MRFFEYNRFLVFLFFFFFFSFVGLSQPVPVCEGAEFDLQAYLNAEFTSCSIDSIEITASTVSGIAIGEYLDPFEATSDGTITVEIYESDETLCAAESIDFDLVEANFVATALQGSCLLVDITPPSNTANCTYTYTIEGNTVTGPISQYQFSNGGLQSILLEVQCGLCFADQLVTVDVDVPLADLSFSPSEVFFEPSFDSFVLCTDELSTVITLTDNSQVLNPSSTISEVTIIYPNLGQITGSTIPSPFDFIADQEGEYNILYVLDDGGCLAVREYKFFVSNPNETVELDVSSAGGNVSCEGDVFELVMCQTDCDDNPPGTIYQVIYECSNFFFETTEIPDTVFVPLGGSSCGTFCESSGLITECSCEIVVRARRPCVTPLSNTICPFQVTPLPDARFDIFPITENDTYCTGSDVVFDPDWIEEDCNGPNPTVTICEIQNPEWTITPTGWTVPGDNLNVNSLSAQFADPGEYTVTFEWSNNCGVSTQTETVCILPNEDPLVEWFNTPIYCVGQTIDPTVDLPNISCLDADIEWTGDDLTISDPTSPSPIVEFTETGSIQLEIDVEGLCNDFTQFVTYTVCDEPAINLSQTDLELCVGQEFCFDQLLSLNWNNCVGDVTWQFDYLPGSPILNPTTAELCFTWNSAEDFEFYIEAENNCGFAYDTISVVVTDAPSCAIDSPGDFCIGDDINIDPPPGADLASIQWFFSTDNGLTFNPLVLGMPDNPTLTTQYFVESTVNDCFCVSDTVVAILVPEPTLVLEVSNPTPCPEEPIFLTSQPLAGDLTWDDGTGTSVVDTFFIDAPNAAIIFTATLSYETIDAQCSVTESISINPVISPISITCDLPALICEGDDILPIPEVSPLGGFNFITDSSGDVVLTNVTEIDPSILSPDSYHFVYEIIESECVFRDSCAFDITAPQTPNISPLPDTLCYYETVDFNDLNNLGGAWASSCPSAIDASGLFDPTGASCPPGSVVEIYYSGACILNNTTEIFLVDIPPFYIIQSIPFPCPGDLVTFILSPPQDDVDWTNGAGDFLGTGPSIDLEINSSFTLVANADVGVTTLSCNVQTSISVSLEVNPIDLDCSVFPALWCTGDDPISIPDATPVGGSGLIINDLGDVLLTDPTTIQTENLGAGTFYYVYEITGWGAGNCTFRDSCEFTIAEPAPPVFELIPDSICYNAVFDFNEISGLSGVWSSSCLGSIDPLTGLLDPSSASCLPGTSIELIYSGACIENDTLSVFLIPLPAVSIDLSQTVICANECLPFSQSIDGDFDFYEWTIAWADQELIFVDENPVFCPDEVGLNSSVTVSVQLSVFTNSNPQCSVTETTTIEVTRIPEESFSLVSPQCIESAIALPDCDECQSYDILFSNDMGEFSCAYPGDNCAPPDTGIYQYELIFDYPTCQSDLIEGMIQIIDIPFLSILEAEYDTCSPVVNYSLEYGGFDFTVSWQTSGDLIQATELGNNLYQTIIHHSNEVEVNSLFTDVISVQNICGIVESSNVVFHAAGPDFTLDPDSSIYCQGQIVFLDMGFAQPINVDSIQINYSSIDGSGGIVLDEIPFDDVPFNFGVDFDTLEVNFVVTAFNSCASVTNTLTAFILPTDVSADFDIPFSPPVCVGDSIPIVFNSTGNIDETLRQIETDDPNIEILQILGDWYLIPQEGALDGVLNINLTEFGLCGIDFDQEIITLGPSLNPMILSDDVCQGGSVTLFPVLDQDADLVWQITPDSSLIVDFPPPIFYAQPGLYYPSVTASAIGFCEGNYVDTVVVFEPLRPVLFCDADCDGGRGCKVTFDAASICVGLQNPDLFNSIEWYVRKSFFPAAGSEVEIPVDDLVPCEDNLVRIVAIDANNCRVEVTENIEFTDVLLYAPNAFTPNADSFNDVFKPIISGNPVNYSLRIFDRWGNLVFETTDPEEPWLGNVEGKDYYSDADMYSYIVEYLPCQPEEEEEKRIKRTGMITLIR